MTAAAEKSAAFSEMLTHDGVSLTVGGQTVSALVTRAPSSDLLGPGGFTPQLAIEARFLKTAFTGTPAIGAAVTWEGKSLRVLEVQSHPQFPAYVLRIGEDEA